MQSDQTNKDMKQILAAMFPALAGTAAAGLFDDKVSTLWLKNNA